MQVAEKLTAAKIGSWPGVQIDGLRRKRPSDV